MFHSVNIQRATSGFDVKEQRHLYAAGGRNQFWFVSVRWCSVRASKPHRGQPQGGVITWLKTSTWGAPIQLPVWASAGRRWHTCWSRHCLLHQLLHQGPNQLLHQTTPCRCCGVCWSDFLWLKHLTDYLSVNQNVLTDTKCSVGLSQRRRSEAGHMSCLSSNKISFSSFFIFRALSAICWSRFSISFFR